MKAKRNGKWIQVKEVFVKQSGHWIKPKFIYCKHDSQWKFEKK